MFGRLRQQDEARGPAFARLTAPDSFSTLRRRQRRRRVVIASVASAVVLVTAYRARSPAHPDYDGFAATTGLDLGAVYWRAPSDFLLDTPGRNLLRALPILTPDIDAPASPSGKVRPTDTNSTTRRRSDS